MEIGRCQSNSSQRGVFRGRAGYFRLRRRRQQQCRIPGVAATSATAPDNGRGSVINFATVPVSSYAIDMFKAVFNGAVATSRLLAAAGNPLCGVDTFSLEYRTVGGRAEPTNATAAVMVPRGDGAACSGAQPVVVYNHGTIFEKATVWRIGRIRNQWQARRPWPPQHSLRHREISWSLRTMRATTDPNCPVTHF